MKAKVKLYNHKLRSGSGRIYDIYEIGHPYSQQQRRDQARQEQAEECDATAAALNVTTIRKAYQADYQQATLILQAVEANERKPISHECIRHLATFVVHAWEVDPNHGKVQELEGVMHHLLGSTRMDNNEHDQLENAIKQYCRNSVATPTVCPNVTLLIAVHYVDRLKKRYNHIKGAAGCSYRLVIVAYMMAAKFIHANLRLIIDTSTSTPTPAQQVGQPAFELPASPPYYTNRRVSTERSTLRDLQRQPQQPQEQRREESTQPATNEESGSDSLGPASLASPPASPKSVRYLPPLPPLPPNQRALRAARMEIEFLHFLNYDLTLSDPVRLVTWAHQFPHPTFCQEQDKEGQDLHSSSADEGDDELEQDES